jgi:hypothetical protein
VAPSRNRTGGGARRRGQDAQVEWPSAPIWIRTREGERRTRSRRCGAAVGGTGVRMWLATSGKKKAIFGSARTFFFCPRNQNSPPPGRSQSHGTPSWSMARWPASPPVALFLPPPPAYQAGRPGPSAGALGALPNFKSPGERGRRTATRPGTFSCRRRARRPGPSPDGRPGPSWKRPITVRRFFHSVLVHLLIISRGRRHRRATRTQVVHISLRWRWLRGRRNETPAWVLMITGVAPDVQMSPCWFVVVILFSLFVWLIWGI